MNSKKSTCSAISPREIDIHIMPKPPACPHLGPLKALPMVRTGRGVGIFYIVDGIAIFL